MLRWGFLSNKMKFQDLPVFKTEVCSFELVHFLFWDTLYTQNHQSGQLKPLTSPRIFECQLISQKSLQTEFFFGTPCIPKAINRVS